MTTLTSKTRTLGNTGLEVSAIGFGAWAIGGDAYKGYGKTDDAESMAALNKAYELGCTFFDTADVYGCGHSETLIGKALKSWKDTSRIVIASKVGFDFSNPEAPRHVFSESHIRQACEASLKRLDIEALDLYQLHNPSLELIQNGRMFEVLKALKAAGKIKHYGISIHDPQEGIQAIQIGQVETIQAIYNPFDRRPEPALFGACQETNTGLVIREPFARGFLTGHFDPNRTFEKNDNRAVWPRPLIQRFCKASEALKSLYPEQYPYQGALTLHYILSQDSISVVIPGCKTVRQVEENFSAIDCPPLTPEQIQTINQHVGQVY